jgi:hypothetical protein
MEIINQQVFFKIIHDFDIVPYTQSKGMCEMYSIAGREKIHFFSNDVETPTMACFGHEKVFFTKKMILIEGECFRKKSDINSTSIKSFYADILQLGYDFVEVCSNAPYNFNYETGLRQAGYLRPVGQFSMPITKIIDLTSEIKYNQNWKRNIKKSQSNNLKFEVINEITKLDSDDFISIYKEMSERKSMTLSLNSHQVLTLCKSSNFRLFFVSHDNIRLAAILIQNSNSHAGLLYAATTKNALTVLASFFMYSELFEYLKSTGCKTFDMEKLVPSTDAVNSVFLFKNGVEGTHVQLNGEWSWYRKSYYRPLMYFVKKYLMKKREL